jgi:hypothetical protein
MSKIIFIPNHTDRKKGFLTGKGIVLNVSDAEKLAKGKLGVTKKIDGRKKEAKK